MKNQTVECQFCTDPVSICGTYKVMPIVSQRPYSLKKWILLTIQLLVRGRVKRQKLNLLSSLSDSQLRDIGLSRRDTDHYFQYYENKVRTQWPK